MVMVMVEVMAVVTVAELPVVTVAVMVAAAMVRVCVLGLLYVLFMCTDRARFVAPRGRGDVDGFGVRNDVRGDDRGDGRGQGVCVCVYIVCFAHCVSCIQVVPGLQGHVLFAVQGHVLPVTVA